MNKEVRKLTLVWLRRLNRCGFISNGKYGPDKEVLLIRALEREQASFLQVMNARQNFHLTLAGIKEG